MPFDAETFDAGMARLLALTKETEAVLTQLLRDVEGDDPTPATLPNGKDPEPPMAATRALPNEVLNLLSHCRIEGPRVYLPCASVVGLPPGRLPRKLYEGVNDALNKLGGKWTSGKVQAHVFPEAPHDLLETALQTGQIVDKKQEFQFFETPRAVAEQLVELLDLHAGCRVLEPSAGRGALARVIREQLPANGHLHLMEIQEENCRALRAEGFDPIQGDFLKVLTDGAVRAYHVTRVGMNPPFTRQQDLDHVRHAAACLDPGGTLVSVMSASTLFRNNRKAVEFREWLDSQPYSEIIELPDNSFQESGTGAKTILVKLRIAD